MESKDCSGVMLVIFFTIIPVLSSSCGLSIANSIPGSRFLFLEPFWGPLGPCSAGEQGRWPCLRDALPPLYRGRSGLSGFAESVLWFPSTLKRTRNGTPVPAGLVEGRWGGGVGSRIPCGVCVCVFCIVSLFFSLESQDAFNVDALRREQHGVSTTVKTETVLYVSKPIARRLKSSLPCSLQPSTPHSVRCGS